MARKIPHKEDGSSSGGHHDFSGELGPIEQAAIFISINHSPECKYRRGRCEMGGLYRDCRRFLLLKRLRFTVTFYLAVVNALCQVQLNSTHSRLGGELVRGEIWVVDTPMATHAQFFFASLSPITPILGTGL